MTDITGAERIRWQRQAASLLTQFLERAAKEGLPVIAWTVGAYGAVLAGECLALPHAQRREHFDAWKAAITALGGAPAADREAAAGGGQTRLVAGWQQVQIRPGSAYPAVQVTLTASIWPDDEDEG